MPRAPAQIARWLALVAGFAVSFAVTGAGLVSALERAEIEYKPVALDVMQNLGSQMAYMSGLLRGEHAVLFLGDSLAMDLLPPDTSIPSRLKRALQRSGDTEPGLRLWRVTGSGLSLFSYYFMSERVVEARPDQIVLSINLATFSEWWRKMERSEMAAWVPARRWSEAATLPLHSVGLSADRLLFYHAIVAAGGFDAWHWLQREQVRATRAYWEAANWLQERIGQPAGLTYRQIHRLDAAARRTTKDKRPTPYLARLHLGPVFDGLDAGNPGVQMLDASLARWRDAGIAVLVYLAPINVEHFKRLGVYDAERMARSIAQIEAVVRRRGAAFLDLHDLLPDAAFRDAVNHLVYQGEPDAANLVAERIAALVVERSRAQRE